MSLWDFFWRGDKKPACRFNRLLELERLEDRVVPDGAAIAVTDASDDRNPDLTPVQGTFRWAIDEAARRAGPDTITFTIANTPQTISLKKSGLTIDTPIIIDATPPFGRPNQLITLTREIGGADGVQDGVSALTFTAGANGSKVIGLTIFKFRASVQGRASGDGIVLNNVANMEINKVNLYQNLNGIRITGANATNNSILGSRLGNHEGGDLRNENAGVLIEAGAHHNHIGGQGTGLINTISGNNEAGVLIADAYNNDLNGNYIGMAADGVTAATNKQKIGVWLKGTSHDNVIGGLAPVENDRIKTPTNVISGNSKEGVLIQTIGANNLVQGNFIGTDKDGDRALGNGTYGVFVTVQANFTWIGGAQRGRGNVIAANGTDPNAGSGISMWASNGTIQYNLIGYGNKGAILGNAGHGIEFGNLADKNEYSDNIIRHNGRTGVRDPVPRNLDKGRNRIEMNGGMGRDVGPEGVTLAGMPVLNSATWDNGLLTVTGTLNSTPNTNFEIAFYGNVNPDPSGYGEGEEYIGTITVVTDGFGYADFSGELSNPYGLYVTATATDLEHSDSGTSEFSLNVPIVSQEIIVAPISDQYYYEGDDVSLQVSASVPYGPPPEFYYSADNLPSGLSIDPHTGFITGTIDYGWTGSFTTSIDVSAQNGTAMGSGEVHWVISQVDILVAPVANQSYYEGDAISPIQVSASVSHGDPLPYYFSADNLPTGLSIDPYTGLITGTITSGAAGLWTTTITVTAQNGSMAMGSVTFDWVVDALASVDAFVWDDANADGLIDPGESGLAGIAVTLVSLSGGPTYTAFTDASGHVTLADILPGEYVLQVDLPAGHAFTQKDQGYDDSFDSDVDPLTGETDPFVLLAGEFNSLLAAGLLSL